MSKRHVLISCASWEERFPLGVEKDLQQLPQSFLQLFFYEEYAPWAAEYRAKVESLANELGSGCRATPLRITTPVTTWKKVQNSISQIIDADDFTVDCSTMPRELLWFILWTLGNYGKAVNYIYHRPKRYTSEWLCREPLEPRLVLKMSGIAKLGRRTALVISAGYDTERVAHLLRVYEPAMAVLLLQKDTPFEDNARRMDEQRQRFGKHPTVKIEEVDSYNLDAFRSQLEPVVARLVLDHNVLFASFGPKLSALAIYSLQRQFPEIGLIYAPAKEFNRKYSEGIGQCFSGVVDAPVKTVPGWFQSEDLDLNQIPDDLLVW